MVSIRGDGLNTALPLNLADAVNRHHVLNSRLTAWWLPLPSLDGGRQLYDLMGLYHGTLTSMGNTSNGWRTTTPPPVGNTSLITDGSFGYVDCGTPSGLNGATLAVLAVWVYKPSNGVTAGAGGGAGTSGGNNRFSFNWFTDGNLYCAAEGTASGGAYGSFAGGSSGWHHLIMAYDGTQSTNATRLRCWWDGLPKTLTFSGTVPSALGNVGPVTLGRDSSNRFCAGQYTDMRLYLGRAWSDSDSFALFDESRRGYPSALNRLSLPLYSASSWFPWTRTPDSPLLRSL